MSGIGTEAVVVCTGTANMASILAGLRRAGATPRLAEGPDEVRAAERVVLPGVGTLAAAMARLEADGTASALAERVNDGRPLLAICLGMQLLFDGSEESPGAKGIAAIPGRATRFPPSVSVPQLGWNRVAPDSGCAFIEPGFAYFANSFRLASAPAGWGVARSEHGGPFVAAIARGAVLACQFHPELSGAWGLSLIERWLAAPATREVRPC
jgi:imidazole glycerol-phosphate synthase subunit HisH